jgi:hypothetical protein
MDSTAIPVNELPSGLEASTVLSADDLGSGSGARQN